MGGRDSIPKKTGSCLAHFRHLLFTRWAWLRHLAVTLLLLFVGTLRIDYSTLPCEATAPRYTTRLLHSSLRRFVAHAQWWLDPTRSCRGWCISDSRGLFWPWRLYAFVCPTHFRNVFDSLSFRFVCFNSETLAQIHPQPTVPASLEVCHAHPFVGPFNSKQCLGA